MRRRGEPLVRLARLGVGDRGDVGVDVQQRRLDRRAGRAGRRGTVGDHVDVAERDDPLDEVEDLHRDVRGGARDLGGGHERVLDLAAPLVDLGLGLLGKLVRGDHRAERLRVLLCEPERVASGGSWRGRGRRSSSSSCSA